MRDAINQKLQKDENETSLLYIVNFAQESWRKLVIASGLTAAFFLMPLVLLCLSLCFNLKSGGGKLRFQ